MKRKRTELEKLVSTAKAALRFTAFVEEKPMYRIWALEDLRSEIDFHIDYIRASQKRKK